jgi:hypothetical protein
MLPEHDMKVEVVEGEEEGREFAGIRKMYA